MSLQAIIILLVCLSAGIVVCAQRPSSVLTNRADSVCSSGDALYEQGAAIRVYKSGEDKLLDSGTYYFSFGNFACKQRLLMSEFYPIVQMQRNTVVENNITHSRLPEIHGNVLYNFNYRSYLDTPYAQRDLVQQLVQTNFYLLIKNQYPVRITLSSRYNNSPYFRNSTDVNVQYNQQQMLSMLKSKALKNIESVVSMRDYEIAQLLYKVKQQEVNELQAWVNSPLRTQEIIEEKESMLRKVRGGYRTASEVISKTESVSIVREQASAWQNQLSANGEGIFLKNKFGSSKNSLFASIEDSLSKVAAAKKQQISKKIADADYKGRTDSVKARIDSVAESITGKLQSVDSALQLRYKKAVDKLDSLKKKLPGYESDVKKAKQKIADSIASLRKQLSGLNTTTGVMDFMQKNHIADSGITKGQKLLLSVNQLGIGRSWVDYSELTVKNISLSGFNIEMNPGRYYFAAAAGKVNYRFRDFVLNKNSRTPDQTLSLLRLGLGHKEGNYIIATFYAGKKSVFTSWVDTGFSNLNRVLGFSLEGRIKVNQNNYITAEAAKSSYGNPVQGVTPSFSDLIGKALNFKVSTNYAWSIKWVGVYDQTDTRVTAFYRYFGKDFQSFNLMPSNVNSAAWMVKLSQYVWRRKLAIEASVRKNDFVSAIANPKYTNSAVFKSFQLSLRVPHYPFVSIGFYPTSQFSVSNNNNILSESRFNTLNVLVNHNYRFAKTVMNSNFAYTKFYNTSSDTGFLYFNASSYTISHGIQLYPFNMQSTASITSQSNLHLVTLEQLVGYQFRKSVSLSGSVKWNRYNHTATLWGGTAALGVLIKKIGTIQLNYDRTYLPGFNRGLLPVDIGRMTYYREF